MNDGDTSPGGTNLAAAGNSVVEKPARIVPFVCVFVWPLRCRIGLNCTQILIGEVPSRLGPYS